MSANKQLKNLRSGTFKEIVLENGHGREVLCAKITPGLIVTGSSDHGLRIWNTKTLSFSKELFSKKFGHQEWVTSVDVAPDGRVVSAGMDGQICAWAKSGVSCDSYLGHQSSISKVMVDDRGIAVTSSYDCTLRIWGLGSAPKEKNSVTKIMVGPHKHPVIDFDWKNSLVVSGDKNGTVAFWDINFGKVIDSSAPHKQGVGIVKFIEIGDTPVACSGGLEDGKVSIVDLRSGDYLLNDRIHYGRINMLEQWGPNSIVTTAVDGKICISDLRKPDLPQKKSELKQPITCGRVIGDLAVCGTVDGTCVIFDLKANKFLHFIRCLKQGAVRVIDFEPQTGKLLIAGDDPSPVVWDLN